MWGKKGQSWFKRIKEAQWITFSVFDEVWHSKNGGEMSFMLKPGWLGEKWRNRSWRGLNFGHNEPPLPSDQTGKEV